MGNSERGRLSPPPFYFPCCCYLWLSSGEEGTIWPSKERKSQRSEGRRIPGTQCFGDVMWFSHRFWP